MCHDFAVNALAIVMYLWLFVAVCYWSYRFYGRFIANKEAKEESSRKPSALAAEIATAQSGQDTTFERRQRDSAAAEIARSDAGNGAKSENLVDQVIREELAARALVESEAPPDRVNPTEDEGSWGPPPTDTNDTAPGGRGGFFKPTDSDAPGVPVATIADLLRGIDMPCDLTPWIDDSGKIDPFHVVFLTTGPKAADVGAGFADELERLGFALRTESDTQLTATKDGAALRITIHPDAAGERRDGQRLFPTAPGGSVAVSIRS